MIKKLALLLCLGLGLQAPLVVGKSSRQENFETAVKVGAGAVCVTGLVYLVATYPEFFGEFFGALLRGLADRRYCYDCDRWYHKHTHHCHGHCHHHCHGGVTITIH